MDRYLKKKKKKKKKSGGKGDKIEFHKKNEIKLKRQFDYKSDSPKYQAEDCQEGHQEDLKKYLMLGLDIK